jgi:hypothetical protein
VFRVALAAGLFFAALGCSEDHDDRPPVRTCTGCGVPGRGGPQGSGGTSSDGGLGEGGAGEPLTFTVARYEGDDFEITAPYAGKATLRGERSDGGSVRGTWTGSGSVTLERLAEEAFVLVTPSDETDDAWPTMFRLPERVEVEPVTLPLVRRTVIDQSFSLPPLPLEPVEGRAQVVFQISDAETRKPLAGATVSASGAEAVLYADGGTFSDAVTETDPTGLVLIANVPAAGWPGQLSTLTVSGAALGSVPYRAVADAISVVRVEVVLP